MFLLRSLPGNIHLRQAWFHKKEAEAYMNARMVKFNPARTVLISYAQNVMTTTLDSSSSSSVDTFAGCDTAAAAEDEEEDPKSITLYEQNVLKDMSDQDTWMHTLRPRLDMHMLSRKRVFSI